MTDSVHTNRPLRVLTIVDLIVTQGGAERLASQIALSVDRDRFESALCVTRFDPETSNSAIERELESAGVKVVRLKRRSALQLRPWRELTEFMREWQPDVVHSHKAGSNFWSALLAPRAGSPALIAHEHGWSFEDHSLRHLVDRRFVAGRVDAMIAVTGADRDRMIDSGLPAQKIRVIHNGIQTPPPPDPSRDVRREFGIGPDQPVVGIVATIRPEKALDVLIRATAELRESFPGLVTLMAGPVTTASPDERPRLEALVAELGLEAQVKLLGGRDDIPELLAAIDVPVLCSSTEASPLSVMEYMEAAKPVVATRVGGIPDMVEDGVTGFLVPPGDPKALAEAIGRLLREPELAARMGAAGRERRRAEFSIEATAHHFEELYTELAGSRAQTNGAGPG